jgi:hypothetical protein
MSRTVSLRDLAEGMYSRYSIDHCYWNYPDEERSNAVKYLEIPINESFMDVIEVPALAVPTLKDLIDSGRVGVTDAIIVTLKDNGGKPVYKTFDRNMKDVLQNDLNGGLIRMDAPNGSEVKRYYATHSAIFDEQYNPVMMCTLQIQRIPVKVGSTITYQYKTIKPILRVAPATFVTKENPMEKFIANKIVPECLKTEMFPALPYIDDRARYAEVIIGDIPFKPIVTDSPSISTTNRELINIVVDHIGEVMQ